MAARRRTALEDHQDITDVMNSCTHDIATEVDFRYLRPHLVPLFSRNVLSMAEVKSVLNCYISHNQF